MVVEARRDSYAGGMFSLTESTEAVSLLEGKTFLWEDKEAERLQDAGLLAGSWAAWVVNRESVVTSITDHFSLKADLIEHTWSRRGTE